MLRRIFPCLLAALLLWPTAALADREKEEEQGPDSAGIGVEPEGEQQNPLKKILELMRDVERRLLEANALSGTLDRQRQILEGMEGQEQVEKARQEQQQIQQALEAQKKLIEAMDGQETVIGELEELIKQAEQQAQQQQGGGQQQQQQQGKTAQQRREQRQQQRNARMNPQQQEQQQKDNARQSRNDRRSESDRRPQDPDNPDLQEVSPDGRRWGILPPVAQEDVSSGRSATVPPAYSQEWEELMKALAGEEE